MRRELLLAVASLLLGAATAVGVAWWICHRNPIDLADHPEYRWAAPSGAKWSARVWLGRSGRDACNVSWRGPSVWAGEPRVGREAAGWLREVLPHSAWRSMVSGSARLAPAQGFWNMQAYGWPRRCIAGGFVDTGGRGGGINLGWWRAKWLGRWAPLAVNPIWSGLCVDAAVFAVPWWSVLVGAIAARWLWRRCRGRCARCGYDLTGSGGGVCPECGLGAAVAS